MTLSGEGNTDPRIGWWVTSRGGICAGKVMHGALAGPFATRQEALDAREALKAGQ